MPPLKCLFVDWHGTLSTSLFWDHFREETHQHHFIFKDGFASIPNFQFADWMRGKVTSEMVIADLCHYAGFEYQFVFDEFVRSCKAMKLVSDEVQSLISDFKAKGIRVAIATNNTDSFSRWTVPSLGLDALFDDILNSYDLRGLKWDVDEKGESLFFECFLQKYGIGREESILIDDNAGPQEHAITKGFGIEYRQIITGTGLVPELKTLLASLP